MIFYRTDSRKPEELIVAGGFHAWQKLTGPQAMNVLRMFCGNQNDLDLPPVVNAKIGRLKTEMTKYDKETKTQQKTGVFFPLNMADLSRLIKAQKTRDSFWISTDDTEACGGYTSTFKYKIRFDSVEKIKINSSTIGGSSPIKSRSKPYIYIDAGKKNIAVELKGQAGDEVSFLTSIPIRSIVEFKPTSNTYKIPSGCVKTKNGWWKMPHRKPPPLPKSKPWLTNS